MIVPELFHWHFPLHFICKGGGCSRSTLAIQPRPCFTQLRRAYETTSCGSALAITSGPQTPRAAPHLPPTRQVEKCNRKLASLGLHVAPLGARYLPELLPNLTWHPPKLRTSNRRRLDGHWHSAQPGPCQSTPNTQEGHQGPNREHLTAPMGLYTTSTWPYSEAKT
jgi:hypothetical protein